MKILTWLRRESLQILLLAPPFVLAALWWNKLPPTVVTHWDIHGHPNGWMHKGPGTLAVPLLNVAVCILIGILPLLDPVRRNPDAHTPRQRRLRRRFRLAYSGFGSLVASLVVLVAAGWRLDVITLGYDGALALLVIVGNFIGSLEPSYLFGVRLPWVPGDAATWRAVHRSVGRWMVFGALALLAAGLFVPGEVKMVLLLAYGGGLGAWSLGYSLWFYRRRLAGGE